jgi:hypothetical protein
VNGVAAFLRPAAFSAAAALALASGCGRQPAPREVPLPKGGPVGVVEEFGPGDPYETFRSRVGLGGDNVRERSGLEEGRRSLVYFLPEGNLHVDLRESGTGEWVLSATPFFVPSDASSDQRLDRWDSDRKSPAGPARTLK